MLLTLKDLSDYCLKNNLYSFQAKTKDESILVSIPATYAEGSSSDSLSTYLNIKACHTGENLNKSSISNEVMEKALPTFALRPVLASIVETTDEDGNSTLDFNGHDMELGEDKMNPGETRMHYIEQIVGVVSPDNIHMEKEDDSDKSYVYATGIIFKDYTYAADILERRKDVDVSVELSVSKFSFDTKKKVLNIEEFEFSGITLLGASVNPGMAGSHASIEDFSLNRSQSNNDDIMRLEHELRNAIEKFYEFCDHMKGGENLKFEELLSKYGKTIEDITFDYANMSDEELESAFAEAFGSVSDPVDPDPVNPDPVDPEPVDPVEPTFTAGKRYTILESGNAELTFAISHEDIRYALYNLLTPFEDSDNEWYFINSVYDDHFVYENWRGDKIYGQAYSTEGDNVSLEGERWELFRELLTASEKAELETMRANYTSLQETVEKYQNAELHAKREEVMSNEDYSILFNSKEYKDLYSEMDNYSVEELDEKLTIMIGKYAKAHKTFAKDPDPKKSNKVSLFNKDETVDDNPFKTIFTREELQK